MTNQIYNNSNGNEGQRTLAYDTRVLPPDILTKIEIDTLRGINGLIKQVKQLAKDSKSQGNPNRPLHQRRDRLERARRNNIIMIDGNRGAGKTSLLLTLLKGWLDPKFFKDTDLQNEFETMKDTVLALHPIDFDPLPQNLSLYNWIIQAFAPLVDSQSGNNAHIFLELEESRQADQSLNSLFRELQQVAAAGWSTGKFMQVPGRDVEDYLVWQGEQQFNWQNLQSKWQNFLGPVAETT